MSQVPASLKNVKKHMGKVKSFVGATLKEGDWPNGARCAVAITFDTIGDGILLRSPQNVDRWKVLSSHAYGPMYGIRRTLDVLDKCDVKGTYFVPGLIAQAYPEEIEEIHERGHEIAHIGAAHENFEMYKNKPDEEEAAVQWPISVIEGLVGERPVGARIPGMYSPNVFKLLLKYRFLYDSSWKGCEMPFRMVIDGKETDLIQISSHFEIDEWQQFHYLMPYPDFREWSFAPLPSPKAVYELWTWTFDAYYRYGLCCVAMWHPLVIGKPHTAVLMEKWIRYIQGKPNVWITTLKEIAEYAKRKLCS